MKIVLIGVVLLIVIGGVWYISSNNQPAEVVPEALAPETTTPVPTPSPSRVIVANDAGFFPSSLAVKVGETITFKNESSQPSWPASAIHPTHTVYPSSDIRKCGTQDQPMIFDACIGLASGEEWSFKFDILGTWKYHDHLNPSHYGTVIVE